MFRDDFVWGVASSSYQVEGTGLGGFDAVGRPVLCRL